MYVHVFNWKLGTNGVSMENELCIVSYTNKNEGINKSLNSLTPILLYF